MNPTNHAHLTAIAIRKLTVPEFLTMCADLHRSPVEVLAAVELAAV